MQLSDSLVLKQDVVINMAGGKGSKNTIVVAPTNIVQVMGSKRDAFGLNEDEKAVILFVRNHGGRVPEARVKSESGVADADACIEKLISYDYAKKDKTKIILTNNGEYVAQAFRMETVKYK